MGEPNLNSRPARTEQYIKAIMETNNFIAISMALAVNVQNQHDSSSLGVQML